MWTPYTHVKTLRDDLLNCQCNSHSISPWSWVFNFFHCACHIPMFLFLFTSLFAGFLFCSIKHTRTHIFHLQLPKLSRKMRKLVLRYIREKESSKALICLVQDCVSGKWKISTIDRELCWQTVNEECPVLCCLHMAVLTARA